MNESQRCLIGNLRELLLLLTVEDINDRGALIEPQRIILALNLKIAISELVEKYNATA